MSKSAVLLDLKWSNRSASDAFDKPLTEFDLINWEDGAQKTSDLSTVKYAVVWNPEPGLMAKCPNLEVIFSAGAGVDHVFLDPYVPDLPIVRFVDPDLTAPMVEWVVLQVLLHLRQQRGYDANQRAHEWLEFTQPMARDFRIGIMGFGELGQASAKALLPLGFQINSWSRSAKSVESVTSYFGNDQFDDFLSETDILISLLPLTDETTGILNAGLFSKLAKNGPFGAPILINAGRGKSQIETDIAKALVDGSLQGASLDVFETEPLSVDSPLWDLDNLFITPHSAAISHPASLAAYVAQQISRYERGDALENLIDKSRGY